MPVKLIQVQGAPGEVPSLKKGVAAPFGFLCWEQQGFSEQKNPSGYQSIFSGICNIPDHSTSGWPIHNSISIECLLNCILFGM